MPEGDTIHRAAATLTPVLLHKVVRGAFERGMARRDLPGKKVTCVEAQGKHLLIGLDADVLVHVHFGIAGKMRVLPLADLPEWTTRAGSLVLTTDENAVIWVRAPKVEILRARFRHAHPSLARLGPDLLDDGWSWDVVRERARAEDARPLGEVLLDQRVVAGIGNVYKSEVCFLQRVNPFAPVAALDDGRLEAVIRRAAALLGANLGPWRRTTTADLSAGERPRSGLGRYHVYGRRGRPCHECGTTIAARAQGDQARTTYYCPSCQGVTTTGATPSRPTRDDRD